MFAFTIFNGNSFYRPYWKKLVTNSFVPVETITLTQINYQKCLIKKVEVIEQVFKQTDECLYLDCDCEIKSDFRETLRKLVEGKDLAFRVRDKIAEPVNAGVLYFRNGIRSLEFIHKWKALVNKEGIEHPTVDQWCFNKLITDFPSECWVDLGPKFNFMSHDVITHDETEAFIIHHKVSRLEENKTARKWRNHHKV